MAKTWENVYPKWTIHIIIAFTFDSKLIGSVGRSRQYGCPFVENDMKKCSSTSSASMSGPSIFKMVTRPVTRLSH